MKRKNNLYSIGALLLILFIGVSVYTFEQCNQIIEDGYLATEGNAAQNFAVLTASTIHLSEERVQALKDYSYAELQQSEENRALKDMMSSRSFATKVDYAYVMIHLKDSEVCYAVTEENADVYDAPVGTKLDILWLLDVNVSEDAAELNVGTVEQRYSYYIEEDARIFGDAPTYLYHASPWGSHICGYAPLYSTEGHPIGVVGVELKTGDFEIHRREAMQALGMLLGVSVLLLTLLFVFLYYKNRQMQLERIYTDPLTQLHNRSYYTDHFVRRMNGSSHRHGSTFALMIADVDLFKRVNDTFGHDAGDQVLQELGQILLETFSKDHVFRFGGEEFVVGLWTDSEEELRSHLDKLFARIAAQRFTTMQLTVSLSLGCCTAKYDQLNGWLISDMLKVADMKLYEAKQTGRCRYIIESYTPGESQPDTTAT